MCTHTFFSQLGSRSALSDLSPVAGWSIIDCHPEKMAQEIRAICTGTDEQCDHLYQNGVIGTIVRLPEEVSFSGRLFRSSPQLMYVSLAVWSDAFCSYCR